MKRRIITLAITALSATICFAQQANSQPKKKQNRSIKTWSLNEKTATKIQSVVDTGVYNYPNEDPMNKYSLAYAYQGTLGSPLQSRIYFDRTEKTEFLFSAPYDAYFISPSDIVFYDVKTPYTYLDYQSYGKKLTHEDDFKGLVSINVNKKFNFTGMYNYVGSNGVYNEQSTKQVKGGLWGYYSGKNYAANAIVMYQNFNNKENGGITSERFITNPDTLEGYEPVIIPTNLTGAKSSYRNFYAYYNHKLHLANVKHMIDTVKFEYRPIASIFHTFKYELAQKRYLNDTVYNAANNKYYKNDYYGSVLNSDSARYQSVRNTVGLSINEGFSKYFPMNVIAYVEHNHLTYLNQIDTINRIDAKNIDTLHLRNRASEDYVLLGGEISKRSGRYLLFNANGEIYTIGDRAGDFKLEGGMSSKFAVFSDTVIIRASAFMKNLSPTYFEENYISNHFKWSNNFDRTFRTRVSGQLEWHNKFFDVIGGLGAENVKNYIYFDQEALPQQYAENIQVLSGNAELNLHLWILHIMNKGVYQVSSNEDVLPLPEISSYHNAFIAFKMFKKVLTTQIGADMSYFSAYYGPNYMPATGVFYLQNAKKIGDYPLVSAYLNFHLKTARFYFKYYHLNAKSSGYNYFSMPNYPLYPERFKMGISMNLYD